MTLTHFVPSESRETEEVVGRLSEGVDRPVDDDEIFGDVFRVFDVGVPTLKVISWDIFLNLVDLNNNLTYKLLS